MTNNQKRLKSVKMTASWKNKLVILGLLLIPALLVPLVSAIPAMSITMATDPQSQNFILVGKPLLYVNGTDYHIKGTVKSVSNYTLPSVLVSVDFRDNKTGMFVNSANNLNGTRISPNQTLNFDINTNYTKAQGDKEFRYFNATIGTL